MWPPGGRGFEVLPAASGPMAIISDASLHSRAIGRSNKILALFLFSLQWL